MARGARASVGRFELATRIPRLGVTPEKALPAAIFSFGDQLIRWIIFKEDPSVALRDLDSQEGGDLTKGFWAEVGLLLLLAAWSVKLLSESASKVELPHILTPLPKSL